MPNVSRRARRSLDRRHLVAAAAWPLVTGCYTTRPLANPAAAPAGAPVEVTLTARGTEELTSTLGPQVSRLQGTLLQAGRDSLALSLQRTTKQDAREDPWQGQRVAVPSAYVASVSTHTLSRSRSWLVAGAIVVGAVLVAAIGRGLGADSDNGGGVSVAQ